MKYNLQYKKILLCIFLAAAVSSHAQQQITHTTTKENISCNYDCTILDVAALTNNPDAVIFVTPVTDKGAILNTHPIGAYYFKSKWQIFNLDSKPIPVGSKFTVEYFASPDESRFQYSFARSDIQADGSALIDNWHLNNNPTVRFNTFLNWNPATQGAVTNREEITVQYNPGIGKWFISNNNNKPIVARVTYNIAITWPGRVNTQIIPPRTSVQIKELTTSPNTNQKLNPIGFMFMAAWADGIKLPGENLIAIHAEQSELLGFEMGASKTSRANSYEPITIKFHSGIPATIQMLNAFIKKQSMVFSFDAISTSANANRVVNYTIKLTGAYISSYKQILSDEDRQHNYGKSRGYDEIKIMFTKIEYTNSNGETAIDNL